MSHVHCWPVTYLHIKAVTVFIEVLIDDSHNSSVAVHREKLHTAVKQGVNQLRGDGFVRV